MPQEHIWKHNSPGAYSEYAPGAYLKCTMFWEHVASVLLEHCTFIIYAPGHIELKQLAQIILLQEHHAPGPAVPGASASGA